VLTCKIIKNVCTNYCCLEKGMKCKSDPEKIVRIRNTGENKKIIFGKGCGSPTPNQCNFKYLSCNVQCILFPYFYFVLILGIVSDHGGTRWASCRLLYSVQYVRDGSKTKLCFTPSAGNFLLLFQQE
jgi:hypothetical protein